jgi:hypothetical protein
MGGNTRVEVQTLMILEAHTYRRTVHEEADLS